MTFNSAALNNNSFRSVGFYREEDYNYREMVLNYKGH